MIAVSYFSALCTVLTFGRGVYLSVLHLMELLVTTGLGTMVSLATGVFRARHAAAAFPATAPLHRQWRLLTTQAPVQHAKRVVSATVVALDEEGDALATTHETTRMLRVPFAVPGDRVEVEIWDRDLTQKHQSPMFAQLHAVTEPSADRVAAPCSKLFGVCGGCKHQNVRYEQQLTQKQRRIEALFGDIPIRRIMGVPEEAQTGDNNALYRYRNKMEFTCSTGRWLLASDMAEDQQDDENKASDEKNDAELPTFTIGMFPVSSVGTRRARAIKKKRAGKRAQWNSRILSIDNCVLQDAACDALLERIRTLSEELEIAAYDFDSHEGFLKNLILRRGVVDGKTEIMVGFVTTTFEGEQQAKLDQLVASLVAEAEAETGARGPLVSIVQRLDEEALRHRRRRGEFTADNMPTDLERVLFGRDYYHDSILDHKFQVSIDSFFQPNSTQASTLYSVVRDELAQLKDKPVVWDLFCGVGSIGICMGSRVKKLVGFELVDAAVEMAKRNAQLNGYDASTMEFHRLDLSNQWSDVEAQLLAHNEQEKPHVIIVDPPRAGLHKKLVSLLRRLAPPRICYVSCNPATQARDFELFTAESSTGKAPYVVDFLQPVDMLPHTPHIETVAWLTRVDSPSK